MGLNSMLAVAGQIIKPRFNGCFFEKTRMALP